MNVEFFGDTDSLTERFAKLAERADSIEIAVAWAGKPDQGAQDILWSFKAKVEKLVVGCSLLNTDPDFLEKWQGQEGFRVVLDMTEIFHPKLYLFRTGSEFYLFVGSSNLTVGGFNKNREANVLLHGGETGSISDARAYIRARHEEASKAEGTAWIDWLKSYRAKWREKQAVFKGLNHQKPKKPNDGVKMQGVGEWSFDEYFNLLKTGNAWTNYSLTDWLELLEHVRKRWSKFDWSLKTMPKEDRQIVASTAKNPHLDAGLFGSMGLGYFLHAVISEPASIDRAMKCIPRNGKVETHHWLEFKKAYSSAFENATTGTASRLLCFWRPDIFFSANSGSIPEIANCFGLSQKSLRTWEGYWEATKWMMQRPWVRSHKPSGELAERCWMGRVALLDVLMYRGL